MYSGGAAVIFDSEICVRRPPVTGEGSSIEGRKEGSNHIRARLTAAVLVLLVLRWRLFPYLGAINET